MCFSQLQRVPAQHSDRGSHSNTFNAQKGCATGELRPQTPEDTFAWFIKVNGFEKSKLPGWGKV